MRQHMEADLYEAGVDLVLSGLGPPPTVIWSKGLSLRHAESAATSNMMVLMRHCKSDEIMVEATDPTTSVTLSLMLAPEKRVECRIEIRWVCARAMAVTAAAADMPPVTTPDGRSVPCHAVPCHAVPCRAVLCCTALCRPAKAPKRFALLSIF